MYPPFDEAKFSLTLFNPVREGVSHDPSIAAAATADITPVIGRTVGAGMAAVVRPANRDLVDKAPGAASAWLGGDQVIEIHDSLFLAANTDKAVQPASYLLTLAVEGKPEQGPEVITVTKPEPLPPVTDEQSDATASASASSSPSSHDASDQPVNETGGLGWLPLFIGIGAAVITVGLAIWWTLSRRRSG